MSPLRTAFVCVLAAPALWAQVSDADFAAIKKEGLGNSKVMDHLDHLVNRIGPRLTGSDNLTVACEWAVEHFQSMGIENAHMEQWGEFPVGFNRGPWWGRMTSPEQIEFVCSTDAWTAGTHRPSRGPLLAAPKDEAELDKLKGELRGVWLVLTTTPRGALFEALNQAMIEEGGFGYVTGREGQRGELLLTSGNS
ncbi:MAG: hypothetical protein KDC95_24160, partial [Planctomycetes bacterium]|nr:hypothetical protein [Planctomycetota bacterium]